MTLQIDTDIPAGNAIIEEVGENLIRFRPDCRDTKAEPWFYWHFRVRGAGDHPITIESTVPHSMTSRGAAVSRDGGRTWQWIERYNPSGWSFVYDGPPADDLRFSLAMPYTLADFERRLQGLKQTPGWERLELCQSRAGRSVPLLRAGRLDGQERFQVLITARHHCCEMMASYELEGLLEAVLADDSLGRALRESVLFLLIPFVDLDGVEAGDQGKLREPHDHNRDYIEASIYPETQAVRSLVAQQTDERLIAGIDLHCPWVRWGINEKIYLVGSEDLPNARRQVEFALALEDACQGPLPYHASTTLPYGADWNVRKSGYPYCSFGTWMTRHAPGSPMITTIELPYSTAHGAEVNAQTARQFGRDIAIAIHHHWP